MKKLFRILYGYIRQTDGWLWLLCLGLSGFSMLLLSGIVHSGVWAPYDYGLQTMRIVGVQFGATAVGVLCALILSKFDYHALTRLWKLHAPVAYAFVLLTFLIGIGAADRQGDKSWIRIPFTSMTIQPAEFLKLSFILTLAYHLHVVSDVMDDPKTILALCVHGAAPILLIHMQGDDGTALVFAFIFIGMLFAAGIHWFYVLAAVGGSVIGIPLIWFFVLNDFQKQRFLILFSPTAADTQGTYYQQYRAKLAIGSGQIWGKGIFSENHHYVPEAQNDFIFSFIGESLGFVGALAVVLVLISLVVKILSDAQCAEDLQGRLICVGVFSMIAAQSVINIGMCLSVLPVIGITLPFLSAGGSSVLASYLGLGLVLSVYLEAPINLFSE